MSIFNVFGANPELKAAVESEKRQMQFQRETETTKIVLPEDRSEIMSQEGKSDLLKWQQDLDDELKNLVYTLKGYSKNSEGVMEVAEGQIPLCNDLFVMNVVIPQCKPFLSRNLINSTFTEDIILMDLKNTVNTITANLADGYDIYDIDFINYDLVLRLIKNTIRAGAFRALNGFTKKTDSKIHKVLESTFDNPNQGKSGMMGFGKKN